MNEFVRVVPLEEVRAVDLYSDLADLAEIFNHEIVEFTSSPESRFGGKPVWHWKSTNFVRKLFDGITVHTPPEWTDVRQNKIHFAAVDVNQLWVSIHNKEIPIEEAAKIYMQMGYSLSGFCEVFSKSAEEMDLEDARPVSEEEYHNGGHQTVIDWLNEKYKGQVLKNL